MESDPTAVINNYMGVGIQYTTSEIYVGQILLSNNLGSPTNTLGSNIPYYYFNTTSTNSTIYSGSFGIANLVFKVPANTKNIYNFETCIIIKL